MSIELPGEVVWIMDLMGLEWPDIDEDELRAWAGHVREFGQNLAEGHSGLDSTLNGLADAYEGASYDALLSRWNQVSGEHHTALTNCCEVLATALEVAATGVVVAKGVVIAQLVITAVEMAAAAAAAVATLGIAAAAEAAAIEIGRRIIREVIQEIEDVLIAELVSMAIEPFQAEIEKAVSGLVFKGVDAALGAAGGAA
ncbi:WXG100 family type VII secretion target [Streptomyces nigrescens]